MEQQHNKLFAIIKNTWTHPELGYTVPHIFGAIFDVDAQGRATDFTPLDFDGKYVRDWRRNNFGRSEKIDDHFVDAEQALFFPITETSAEMLKEAMHEITTQIKNNRNAFYFAGIPVAPKPALERFGRPAVRFDGSVREGNHVERLSYQRRSDAPPRVATNCMDFLQNMLEQIGGIPLDDLSLEGKKMPRQGDTRAMADFMVELAGNKGKLYHNRTNGRLISMRDGRYAYAYDCPTGWITSALNDPKIVPKQQTSEGKEIALAQFLIQQSKPFYDSALNQNDLSLSATSTALSR